MTAKKRPGQYKGLPRGTAKNSLEWDLNNPFYEGFAEKSEPGQGRKGFPAPPRYWKRYKFERKSLKITGELDGDSSPLSRL